jgi:hypothetical protein
MTRCLALLKFVSERSPSVQRSESGWSMAPPWSGQIGVALPALLLSLLPMLPARAASIDLICSLPPTSPGDLGTMVDFSLSDVSGSGSSFWPASGQRQPVVGRVSSSTIQILQPSSGALLFSIDRLNGGISNPNGLRGRCTNAGTVRVEQAI